MCVWQYSYTFIILYSHIPLQQIDENVANDKNNKSPEYLLIMAQ